MQKEKRKDETRRSKLDYTVVEHGHGKERPVPVCAEDVETTDQRQKRTESQHTKAKRSGWDRNLYKWRMNNLGKEDD